MIVLRKFGKRLEGAFLGSAGMLAPAASGKSFGTGMLIASLLIVAVLVLPVLILGGLAALIGSAPIAGFALANALLVTRKNALGKLLEEMKTLQEKYVGQIMPQNEGEKFENLAKEAKSLQDEIDRAETLASFEAKHRGAPSADRPLLPEAQHEAKGSPDEVVGYISLGEAFTTSPEFAQFKARGFSGNRDLVVSFAGASFHLDQKGQRLLGVGVVPVTRKMAETKAVPTIGADYIRPSRTGELVRSAEAQRLTIRDLLNVSRTDSNAIEYTTMTDRAAQSTPVADAGLKPEAAMVLGTATAPVRTIAVWIPVTEQQLQDVAQLQNMIDVELRWDLGKTEEVQVTWGDGTGSNLLGIFNTPGVSAGRTVAGDTILDLARRSMTDVVLAGGSPNGIVLDPLDWESAQLAKGTDDRYVWAVVTNDNGSRLWGLRVVESLAMREPGTYTTNERRMLVGDFIRGATLWDRQQANVAVGYKDDDFIRNLRTIRAEERLAFGVKRPAFFKYRITQARVL